MRKSPRLTLLLFTAAAYAGLACADGSTRATSAVALSLPPAAPVGSVLFRTDSTRIEQALWPMLRTAAALARQRADIVIELTGHADVRGSRNHNLTLSVKRVESVAAFLIRHGVDPAQITTRSYGETRASANVNDHSGQFYDRRVSISLTTGHQPT